MIWTNDNLQSGEVVGFPTTSGDFKDIVIVSRKTDVGWITVSLLDGLQSDPVCESQFIDRLNLNHAMPIAKVLARQGRGVTLPENRAELPMVVLYNLRGTP